MIQKRDLEQPAVIFLHIPKTAGTTLHRIIERQYRQREIFTIGGISHESIEQFRSMSEERRAKYRMIKGHLGFGFHEFVPGPSAYFTILRNPIERVISFFYWVRRTPHHYLYDFMISKDIGLKEYLESGANVMLDNAQVRMVSGVWYNIGFGECTEETLEIAKRNLREECAVVGLTERFDETLILLKRAFGWRNLHYARQNVTASRPRKDQLAPETLDAVVKVNRLDLALYQYATALFEEEIEAQGPAFAEELKAFQAANRWKSPFYYVFWEIRKRSLRVFVRNWINRLFG
jgi:hypothetical protein